MEVGASELQFADGLGPHPATRRAPNHTQPTHMQTRTPLPNHPSARAAAIDQLVTLGGKIDVPVFELGTGVAPPEIARWVEAGMTAESQAGAS